MGMSFIHLFDLKLAAAVGVSTETLGAPALTRFEIGAGLCLGSRVKCEQFLLRPKKNREYDSKGATFCTECLEEPEEENKVEGSGNDDTGSEEMSLEQVGEMIDAALEGRSMEK